MTAEEIDNDYNDNDYIPENIDPIKLASLIQFIKHIIVNYMIDNNIDYDEDKIIDNVVEQIREIFEE